jgi:hypothetical protein
MSTDKEFAAKWRARIDGCGPCCSCLVILLALAFATFLFLIH